VNDITGGVLLKSFAPTLVLVMCKHPFCNALWLIIFVLLCCFDCACDMFGLRDRSREGKSPR